VSKCLHEDLKTIPILSADIGDHFCSERAIDIEKGFNLIKKHSILLAKYIKLAQK